MHIARSRVQFPQENRAQNANEFIDQKKEMFLAELAYNTVDQEITELELKQQRRNQSLIDSAKELEVDKMDLHQYIAKDKALRVQKEDDEKKHQNEKASKEDQIKKFDQRIAQAKSEIEKHKDTLNGLTSNQEFLLELSPEEFRNQRETEKEAKYQKVKKQWIDQHKANPDLDYDIVFTDDEEIHEGVKMRFSFQNQPHQTTVDGRKKGGQSWK